ncbi:hypothetical protein IGI04_032890 [Brassica rapa subsp. trilocularis]|uniref:RNase H type-1 domain-containing protein n=1 Tax=Brassica rapa subsp. trilocularis TaxID=1813537 RepID=A0ABQ7L4C1_BRACM|nr:hypothetical protein IGI04_032890 [Brassica rapa subsp. trilocularis]
MKGNSSSLRAYLCDSNDNSKKSETNKALRNHQVLLAAHLEEAAELAAMIQGLSWALKLVVKSIQFFCDDDSIILDYTSLTSCQTLPLLRSDDDINSSSLIKLVRDAIASQTTWHTNTEEYETCPDCYAHVSPRHKLEDNELELVRHKLDLVSLEEYSTYRLCSKGLVSEEVIKNVSTLVGGSGMSLCYN